MSKEEKNPLIELLTGNKKTVDARELHRLLEIKVPFEEWMETQIKKLGLVENKDYCKIYKRE
jgi:phage anti-repressor protein